MDNIFKSFLGKKLFFTVVLCILIVILLIRIFIVPILPLSNDSTTLEIINSIIDNLFASLITTVVVAWFLFWVSANQEKKKIELVESTPLIEKKFKIARNNTDYWYFNGGTGRYTRTVTIPDLSKMAFSRKSNIQISIILINPNDQALCTLYANYKNSLSDRNVTTWSSQKVRLQIYTTILVALSYENAHNFLQISVYLKDNFSLLRMDISQNYVIITKEDPSLPVLVFEREFYLFSPYKEDFNQTIKQSKKITSNGDAINTQGLDIINVKHFFEAISIKGPDEDEIKEIIKLTEKSENPFPVGFKIDV